MKAVINDNGLVELYTERGMLVDKLKVSIDYVNDKKINLHIEGNNYMMLDLLTNENDIWYKLYKTDLKLFCKMIYPSCVYKSELDKKNVSCIMLENELTNIKSERKNILALKRKSEEFKL